MALFPLQTSWGRTVLPPFMPWSLEVGTYYVSRCVFCFCSVLFKVRACMLSHFSHVQLCDPMDCNPPGSSVHESWDSPGRNTGAGCHALLQGTFPTQGSHLRYLLLSHWQVGSLSLRQKCICISTLKLLGPLIYCLLFLENFGPYLFKSFFCLLLSFSSF